MFTDFIRFNWVKVVGTTSSSVSLNNQTEIILADDKANAVLSSVALYGAPKVVSVKPIFSRASFCTRRISSF